MCEDIFDGPIARARQLAHPHVQPRRQLLDHLKRLGYARNSLKAVACELIIIAERVDLSGMAPVKIAIVETAARGWAAHQVRRGHSTSPKIAERNFRYWATQWLRHWGRLIERPAVPPPPFGPLLDGFRASMANEQGLTPLSIRSHAWKTEKFLQWYWPRGRAFANVTIHDIDAFLIAKGRATWSRRSVSIAVQALRAFFRYAEGTHQCRPGLAATICGPRLYDRETLPSGPSWTEVQAMLASLATDRPADIRRVAALLLFATYGVRLREVAGLTLDDVDWEHELIHIRRVKRHDVQTYPLSKEAGTALLRYIRDVRAPGPWRHVFVTLLAPHQPLSPGGLYHLASRVLCARGLRLRHHGPHALRQACATRLLSAGWSFKDIGDLLGHRSTEATAVYAKVDAPSLCEVARFDLGGVLGRSPLWSARTSISTNPWGCAFRWMPACCAAFQRHAGDVELAAITPEVIGGFLQPRASVTSTWLLKHRALRRLFQYAITRGLATHSPVPTAIPRVPETFVPHIYSDDELRRLLAGVDENQARVRCTITAPTYRAMLRLLYGAGLRLAELRALRTEDVDLARGNSLIRESNFYKSRQLPIGPRLTQALAEVAPAGRPDTTAFFLNQRLEPILHQTVWHNFDTLRMRVGVHGRLHDLRHYAGTRHTTATHLLRAGVDINTIRAWLGHVSVETTNVYADIDLATKAQALATCAIQPDPGGPPVWKDNRDLLVFLQGL